MNKLTSEITARIDREDGYAQFREEIARRVATVTGPLFTTTVTESYELFLTGLPNNQQHYNCHQCRRFVNTYGSLVTLTEQGDQVPLLWRQYEGQGYFATTSRVLADALRHAKVTGVFVSDKKVWGTPETPPWTHFYGYPPAHLIYKGAILIAREQAALYRHDFAMLLQGLVEYRQSTFDLACRLLDSGHLAQNQKFREYAAWLNELKRGLWKPKYENKTWRAIATAPAGWGHVKSSMVGSLLDDLEREMTFDEAKRRWDTKMHPLQYRRPQTVSEGNIDQAERIVERLGLAPALRRRFATMADVQCFWRPVVQEPVLTSVGVFEHLRPKITDRRRAFTIPQQRMTWLKFLLEVLPGAHDLKVYVEDRRLPLAALVTAVNPDAPNILQWEPPVSWYLYHQGSHPEAWTLQKDTWVTVKGLAAHPGRWWLDNRDNPYDALVFWLLESTYDTQYEKGGGFFPSMLKSEYHGIRSTLEAYAKESRIAGIGLSDACGLLLQAGKEWNLRVLVNGQDEYLIDRWD